MGRLEKFTEFVRIITFTKKDTFREMLVSMWVKSLLRIFLIRWLLRLTKKQAWKNTSDHVETKYDRIAGRVRSRTYINESARESFSVVDNSIRRISSGDVKKLVMEEIIDILQRYEFENILEVGAGELASLAYIIDEWKDKIKYCAADLSLNSLVVGKREVLSSRNIDVDLCKANALSLPYPDNCFDLVYTSGCIVAMPYDYKKIIKEVCRVSRKHIVLFEASWELGEISQKLYMLSSNYTRGIPMSVNVLREAELKDHFLLKNSSNPFNRVACFDIIKKVNNNISENMISYVCPVCHSKLDNYDSYMYCNSCCRAYLVFEDIPILDEKYSFFITK